MPNINVPGRISIVVPVYNGENYLEESLLSLVHQTYDDLEIVVVDDGSTDRTLEIIWDVLGQSDRRVIIHRTDGPSAYGPRTLGHTFFCGIALSTGEYFGIHSHDNISLPTQYEVLMNIVGSSAVAYCAFMRIQGDDPTPFDPQSHMGSGIGEGINEIITNYAVGGEKVRILTETAIIRKDVYMKMRCNIPLRLDGGWDDEIGIILSAFACGDIAHTTEPLLLFRLLDSGNLVLDPGPELSDRMMAEGYNMDEIILVDGRYNYTQDRMGYIRECIVARRIG